ncbi:alginate lyase domain-containing protein, partial [Gongronella butleri]
HDYISLARYFWPNPNTPDGKPYERHDGLVNPEIHSIPDYWLLHLLTKEVHFLSLSYHYFNNETYAQKGVDLLRQWFVQPELRMNPHMCYGSLIKGRPSGRSQGIMDFSHMPEMLDAIVLLQKSSVWTKEMTAHIRHWFTTYQNWLLTSRFGEAEGQAKNNHGTYYDLQRLSLHLFLKQTDKAYEVLESVKERLKSQISANGELPHETMRPFSWFYSIYNLRAFFQLCRMSQHLTDRSTGQPIDMCQYTRDGETKPAVRLALDYLVPFALNESTWPH